jgi:hypothetical protein
MATQPSAAQAASDQGKEEKQTDIGRTVPAQQQEEATRQPPGDQKEVEKQAAADQAAPAQQQEGAPGKPSRDQEEVEKQAGAEQAAPARQPEAVPGKPSRDPKEVEKQAGAESEQVAPAQQQKEAPGKPSRDQKGAEKQAGAAQATPAQQKPGATPIAPAQQKMVSFSTMLGAIAIVAVVALAVIVAILRPSLPPLTPTPKPTPTPTPILQTYKSDLYQFSITRRATVTSPIEYTHVYAGVYGGVEENCNGMIFSPNRGALPPYSLSSYPVLRICFLNFSAVDRVFSLDRRLSNRIEDIQYNLLDDAQVGLFKMSNVGVGPYPSLEVHIHGRDRRTGISAKWYVAVTEYEGRAYAVEVVSPYQEWDKYWPIFIEMINSLQFHSGVIRRIDNFGRQAPAGDSCCLQEDLSLSCPCSGE